MYQSNAMKAQIRKTLGQYNFCSSDKQWQVYMYFDECPIQRGLACLWDEGDEPDIEGMKPSGVIEVMSERVESYWISTSREQERKVVQWVKDNAKTLDSQWLTDEIERWEKKRQRCVSTIVSLEIELEELNNPTE